MKFDMIIQTTVGLKQDLYLSQYHVLKRHGLDLKKKNQIFHVQSTMKKLIWVAFAYSVKIFFFYSKACQISLNIVFVNVFVLLPDFITQLFCFLTEATKHFFYPSLSESQLAGWAYFTTF